MGDPIVRILEPHCRAHQIIFSTGAFRSSDPISYEV